MGRFCLCHNPLRQDIDQLHRPYPPSSITGCDRTLQGPAQARFAAARTGRRLAVSTELPENGAQRIANASNN